ncbi:MAG: putative capsid protein [Circoviridae sp.]|nr:MAG: putative capsid protein [Circoviridae sp.]
MSSRGSSMRGRSLTRRPKRGISRAYTGSRSVSLVSSSGSSRSRLGRRPYGPGGAGFYGSPYYDPFPAQGKFKLRFSALPIVTAGASGLPGYYTYRANSIYDPDYSGVGHQPYGHDTLATIYNHYVVDRARITVTPIDNIAGQIYGIATTDDPNSIADVDSVREQKGVTFAIGQTQASQQEQIVATYNRWKQWPMPVDTSSLFGANPDEQIYFRIFTQNFGGQGNARRFMVSIEYDCHMYELKDLGES